MVDSPPISVLLIEDNSEEAQYIAEALAQARDVGFHVEYADKLATGLARLSTGEVDVVLLDLRLPDSDGLDTFTRIQAQAPQVPMIVLTGLADEALAVEALAEGAQDYLVKGDFGARMLVRAVRYAIERKRIEDRLREERDKAQQYLDISGVVIVALDVEGRITQVNRKGCQLLGYREEELIGEDWFECCLPAEVRNEVRGYFRELLAGHVAFADYYENEVLTRSGEKRMLVWHNTALVDKTGCMIGALSSGEDMTEHIQAEEKIRQRTEDLALINTINDAVSSGDSLGKVIDILVAEMQRIYGSCATTVYLLSRDKRHLVMQNLSLPTSLMRQIEKTLDLEYIPPVKILLDDASLYQELLQEGHPRLLNDAAEVQWLLGEFIRTVRVPDALRRVLPDLIPKIFQTLGIQSMICAPLISGSERIGLLEVSRREPFTEPDLQRIVTLAGQVTAVIRRVQTEESLERRVAQLELLNDIGGKIAGVLELERVFDRVTSLVQENFGYQHVGLFVMDRERGELVMKARAGVFADLFPPNHRLKVGQGMVGWVGLHGKTLLANDVSAEPRYVNLYPETISVRSELSVPIRVGKEIVGVLDIQSPHEQAFDESDVMVMETLADQVSVAISNARLIEAVRRNNAEIKIASDVLRDLNATPDVTQVFPAVVTSLKSLTGCERVSLALLGEDGASFTTSALDSPGSELRRGTKRALSNTAMAKDILAGRIHLAPDLALDSDFPVEQELYHAGYRSSLNLPLKVGRDEVLGALNFTWLRPAGYKTAPIPLLGQIADAFALALERSRLFTQTQRQATHLETLNATLEERVRQRTFELEVLYELSQKIGYILNTEDLFNLVLEYLHWVVAYDLAGFLQADDGTYRVFLRTACPIADDVLEDVKQRLVMAYCKMCKTPPSTAKVEVNASDMMTSHSTALVQHIGAYVHVPVLAGGDIQGFVFVGAEEKNTFNENHLRILYMLANQTGDAIYRLRALLAAEQQRMEHVVRNLPEGVILLNSEYRILMANPAAQEYLPLLSGSEVQVGGTIEYLGQYNLAEIVSQTRAVPLVQTIDGPQKRVFEVSAYPIRSGFPRPGAMLIMLRDVTELRKIQEQMRQQERLAAVGQLAGGIAHDFNNILTTILLYSHTLMRKPDLPPDVSGGLATILSQTKRASDLVRQILDFSRRSLINRQALDLGPFVKEATKLLQRTFPENIRLRYELETRKCMVRADPTRIQQMVTNLALNARDALPKGGTITIRLEKVVIGPEAVPPVVDMPPGVWMCLSVTDDGTGISPEAQAHLFEPFFTTKAPGKGTGLGLAQVYGIVKQHEGFIDVDTGVDRGTAFHIYLPLIESEVDASSESARVWEKHLPTGQGEVILLVEDEKSIRELAQGILKSLGYRVLTAANGREALELFRQTGHIDLMVTDLVMPELGGEELIRELQKMASGLKVVVITGYAVPKSIQKLRSVGFVSVIQKPFEMDTLAEVVRQALDMPAWGQRMDTARDSGLEEI